MYCCKLLFLNVNHSAVYSSYGRKAFAACVKPKLSSLCGDEANFLNDMLDEMSETYCEGDEPKQELTSGKLMFFSSH